MTDRFIPVILAAIQGLRETGLDIETDDLSTFIGGPPERIFRTLERAFGRAARSGEHVVMTIQLSYG